MPTLVELQQAPAARADDRSAAWATPAAVEADSFDDVELDSGPPLPWLRLLGIGLAAGLAVGLPLVPFAGPILVTAEALAIAAGCPFHLPAQPIR